MVSNDKLEKVNIQWEMSLKETLFKERIPGKIIGYSLAKRKPVNEITKPEVNHKKSANDSRAWEQAQIEKFEKETRRRAKRDHINLDTEREQKQIRASEKLRQEAEWLRLLQELADKEKAIRRQSERRRRSLGIGESAEGRAQIGDGIEGRREFEGVDKLGRRKGNENMDGSVGDIEMEISHSFSAFLRQILC
ncbi:hypothetical protein RUND412_007370 [Rhizina undulata]